MNDRMVQLAQNLDKLEKLRRQTRNTVILSGVIIAVLILLYIMMMNSEAFPVALPLEMSSIVILASVSAGLPIMIANVRRKYKKLYNAVIVRTSLDRYFEIEEFNSDFGIPKSAIDSTNMIRTGNCYKTDDLIRGRYKDIFFMQSDVLMEDRTTLFGSVKSKPVTYFKGRWMIFEFNKRFKCDLMVFEKAFLMTDKRFLLALDSKIEKVEFENAEFNSHFSAYTNNQIEAFYVMTPQLEEAIERLRKNTHGALLLCFKDNVLHVGVNTGKWAFEPPIFSKIDVSAVSSEIDSDISLITRFVDELKLNDKVYKNG